MNQNRVGIVLVVEPTGLLLGTLTDGDVRRAILRGVPLSNGVPDIMCKHPLTVSADTLRADVLEMMEQNRLHHIPALDEDGRVVDLLHVGDFLEAPSHFSTAVIMVGGKGERLRPLTQSIPKSMVVVSDRPVLEHVIQQVGSAGVEKVYLSVNYMAEVIEDHFGDGERFGVRIEYLREQEPLGTGGSLRLLPQPPKGPFLVMNGDILTTTDLTQLFAFHTAHRSVMTIAAAEYRLKVPYGTLRLGNHHLLAIEEKPEFSFHCNAGIYVIEPEVLRFLPSDSPCDMTTITERLLQSGLPVSVFPIHERWIDIGNPADLERARDVFSGDAAGVHMRAAE
jgi:dTDP-glucose pyrophosphorylase